MILSRLKEQFLFYPHLPAITILLSSTIYGSRHPHQNRRADLWCIFLDEQSLEKIKRIAAVLPTICL